MSDEINSVHTGERDGDKLLLLAGLLLADLSRGGCNKLKSLYEKKLSNTRVYFSQRLTEAGDKDLDDDLQNIPDTKKNVTQ